MLTDPVIESIRNRKSVRKYTNQKPAGEVIETVVRAGQQALFASQLCSILLTRKKAPFGAPLWFTVCVDMHRMELIMAKARLDGCRKQPVHAAIRYPGCRTDGREHGNWQYRSITYAVLRNCSREPGDGELFSRQHALPRGSNPEAIQAS